MPDISRQVIDQSREYLTGDYLPKISAVVAGLSEHFAMHTGQILYISKLRTGKDLGFYRFREGVPLPSWPGRDSA